MTTPRFQAHHFLPAALALIALAARPAGADLAFDINLKPAPGPVPASADVEPILSFFCDSGSRCTPELYLKYPVSRPSTVARFSNAINLVMNPGEGSFVSRGNELFLRASTPGNDDLPIAHHFGISGYPHYWTLENGVYATPVRGGPPGASSQPVSAITLSIDPSGLPKTLPDAAVAGGQPDQRYAPANPYPSYGQVPYTVGAGR